MMAATFVPIESVTLASSAASVTFSAIPQTYTDLVLRLSARTDQAGQTTSLIKILTNGLSTSIYSDTDLKGDSTIASSGRDTNLTSLFVGFIDGASPTANTFSSNEIYFPGYTASASKPASSISITENNSASQYAAYICAQALLIRDNNALTTIAISLFSGGVNFVAGSTFHLYGIKNS